ncbi:MAG TPA: caspase family protein, partial [Hyphomicrobiaceae bacterium]|nr:caspase family protein [Hyphomicrobiaceae bacterium]
MRRLLASLLAMLATLLAAPIASAGPNDIAIVIGNKGYRGGTPEVKFAVNDMEGFAKAATDVFGVPRDQVRKFPDASLGTFFELFGRPGVPGEPGAGSLLERLIQSRSTRIFIFYSGHGVPLISGPKPRSHLLPIDGSPAAVANTAYALDDLIAAVKSVLARKAPDGQAIIILDACFSGSSGDGGSLVPATSGTAFNIDMAAIASSERITVLAASSDLELAHWDTERRHGLFTDTLLDGLYGEADEKRSGGNGDRAISLQELKGFVAARMRARLLSLHRDRPPTQSPHFTGRATAEIVKLAASLPERNPGAREADERECQFLLRFGQLAAIESFMGRSTCVNCPCRTALEVKRRSLSAQSSTCETDERL